MEPAQIAALIWSNKEIILDSAAYVVAGAAALAAITPNTKDNKLFSRLLSIVDLLALNIGGARSEVPPLVEKKENFKAAKDAARLIKHAVKGS